VVVYIFDLSSGFFHLLFRAYPYGDASKDAALKFFPLPYRSGFSLSPLF